MQLIINLLHSSFLHYIYKNSGIHVSNKQMLLPRSFVKIQYCGKPPWLSGSVLGLKPQGPEFRIMCLDYSAISFISPSLLGYMYTQRWPNTPVMMFMYSSYKDFLTIIGIKISLSERITQNSENFFYKISVMRVKKCQRQMAMVSVRLKS